MAHGNLFSDTTDARCGLYFKKVPDHIIHYPEKIYEPRAICLTSEQLNKNTQFNLLGVFVLRDLYPMVFSGS